MQKHDVLLCVWLNERTYANLFSRLQLTSQLYYHIDVINVWLTYLSNGIHLSFSMSCDYIFIDGTCFLSALCPFLFLLFRSFFSFLHPHPPLCLSRPSPTPHLSLCWGGCNCCDFDKVFSTCISAYVWMQGVCVCFFFFSLQMCPTVAHAASICVCQLTAACSHLRLPLLLLISVTLSLFSSLALLFTLFLPMWYPPPHLPLLVPSLMFAPSSLSLIDSEAYVTGILRS